MNFRLKKNNNFLNTYVKFHANWILFTTQSIKLIFMHNFRLKKLET